MTDTTRWIVAVAAALLVVALISWARGNPHHHGLQVGSLGTPVVGAAVESPQA